MCSLKKQTFTCFRSNIDIKGQKISGKIVFCKPKVQKFHEIRKETTLNNKYRKLLKVSWFLFFAGLHFLSRKFMKGKMLQWPLFCVIVFTVSTVCNTTLIFFSEMWHFQFFLSFSFFLSLSDLTLVILWHSWLSFKKWQ